LTPCFFPNHHYPDTGVYAGVQKYENNVYVLGGPWGNNPTLIAALPDLIVQITDSGGNGSIPACNTANVPAGCLLRKMAMSLT
jgi:hypothetical protein